MSSLVEIPEVMDLSVQEVSKTPARGTSLAMHKRRTKKDTVEKQEKQKDNEITMEELHRNTRTSRLKELKVNKEKAI